MNQKIPEVPIDVVPLVTAMETELAQVSDIAEEIPTIPLNQSSPLPPAALKDPIFILMNLKMSEARIDAQVAANVTEKEPAHLLDIVKGILIIQNHNHQHQLALKDQILAPMNQKILKDQINVKITANAMERGLAQLMDFVKEMLIIQNHNHNQHQLALKDQIIMPPMNQKILKDQIDVKMAANAMERGLAQWMDIVKAMLIIQNHNHYLNQNQHVPKDKCTLFHPNQQHANQIVTVMVKELVFLELVLEMPIISPHQFKTVSF